MFEGCLQAMSFYLAALGYTLERDAWRFQPVSRRTDPLRCRGQVTPDVETPRLRGVHRRSDRRSGADPLRGSAVYGRRPQGISRAPRRPGARSRLAALEPAGAAREHRRAEAGRQCCDSRTAGRFAFDQKSILACAWGKPSDAFGPMYSAFRCAGARAATSWPALPLHVTRHEDERRDRGHGGRIDGRGRVRHSGRRLVLRRERRTDHAVLRAARSRTTALRLACELHRLCAQRRRRGVLPKPRRHRDLDAELFDDAGTCCVPTVTLTNVSKLRRHDHRELRCRVLSRG